jgi:iron complex outermembrane receptor protein
LSIGALGDASRAIAQPQDPFFHRRGRREGASAAQCSVIQERTRPARSLAARNKTGGEMSYKSVLLLSAALCATASLARAQTTGGAGNLSTLEEVVVTGTKRAENIQDVPASVLVVTAANLERGNVRDFDDLVRVAPSLTISKTTQPANNSINIRGIGTYAFSIATQPSVAVVIDDVPQAFQAAAFAALVDVQQVEILRGPQSTLFGKAASAGVVNIITEAPTQTFMAKAEGLVTDDHEYRLQASVSGPVSDTVAVRLATNYSSYRGNIYNLTTGNWQNGTKDFTLRGKIAWRPTDRFNATLSPYYTRTDATCCAPAQYFLSPGVTFSRANLPQSVILKGITASSDNRLTRLDVDTQGDARDYGAGLRLSYELGGGTTLLSISSYDKYKLTDFKDSDSSDFDFSTLTVGGVGFAAADPGGVGDGGTFEVETITQELRITSPGERRFRYVAGLFYSDTDSVRDYVRGSNNHGDFNGVRFNGQQQLPTSNSLVYSSYLTDATSKTYAVFAQGSYDLTEQLTVVGGLRYHREKLSYGFLDRDTGVTYGAPRCSTGTPTPSLRISTCDTDDVITGKAALQYKVTPNFMAFVNYARGYKGLAYDLTSILTTRSPITTPGPCLNLPVADCVASRQPVPPEKSEAYEVGFKGSFFDRRLTWNMTGFYEEYRNFQAQSRDLELGQNILQSLGRVTSKGVETEMALRVDGFTLNGNATYNVAKMNSFPNAPCYAAQTAGEGCIGGRQNLSGRPLPNAPKWNLSVTGQYDFDLTDTYRGFLQAAYRWQSDVIFNLAQDPDSIQDGYGIANIGAGVQTDRWKLTLFVNNLLDKNYALTKGRDNAWNFSRTAVPATLAVNWKPARDSERYFGGRFSIRY